MIFFAFIYTNTCVWGRDEEEDDRDEDEKEEFSDILNGIVHDQHDRNMVMTKDGHLKYYASLLHPDMERIGEAVEELRQALVECYKAAERDRNAHLKPVWTSFYDKFISTVLEIRDISVDLLPPEDRLAPEEMRKLLAEMSAASAAKREAEAQKPPAKKTSRAAKSKASKKTAKASKPQKRKRADVEDGGEGSRAPRKRARR